MERDAYLHWILLTLQIKLSVLLPAKQAYSGRAEELQFRTYKLWQSHRQVGRTEKNPHLQRVLRGAVINTKPTGENWEFKVQWLFIGRVGTVSHWLGCCQARRKSSSCQGGKVQASSCWECKVGLFLLVLQLRPLVGGENCPFWPPDSISLEVLFILFHNCIPGYHTVHIYLGKQSHENHATPCR